MNLRYIYEWKRKKKKCFSHRFSWRDVKGENRAARSVEEGPLCQGQALGNACDTRTPRYYNWTHHPKTISFNIRLDSTLSKQQTQLTHFPHSQTHSHHIRLKTHNLMMEIITVSREGSNKNRSSPRRHACPCAPATKNSTSRSPGGGVVQITGLLLIRLLLLPACFLESRGSVVSSCGATKVLSN